MIVRLESRGPRVTMLTLPPTAPSSCIAIGLFQTSSADTTLESSTEKLKLRLPSVLTTFWPLTVTWLSPAPSPRTLTSLPSPASRSREMPVMRCRASPMFSSGNLPMSSALMASMIWEAMRLRLIASSMLDRMPRTTISSTGSSASSSVAASCARAAVVHSAKAEARPANRLSKEFRSMFIICPPQPSGCLSVTAKRSRISAVTGSFHQPGGRPTIGETSYLL